MERPVGELVLELLAWIDARPRTYAETIEVWRSNCPRHAVWEDAWMSGFVEIAEIGGGMCRSMVTLTALGKKMLQEKSL